MDVQFEFVLVNSLALSRGTCFFVSQVSVKWDKDFF